MSNEIWTFTDVEKFQEETFLKTSKKRIVRDNGGVFHSPATHENTFHTMYDWPMIEQLEYAIHRSDPRIALIIRNYFDYISYCDKLGIDHLSAIFRGSREQIAKPSEFKYVTYGSDVSDLDVPFDPTNQYLLFSKAKYGPYLFTVDLNLGLEFNGAVSTTLPEGKRNKILMEQRNVHLPGLLEIHKARLAGHKLIDSPDRTLSYAEKTFDRLMYESGHVI